MKKIYKSFNVSIMLNPNWNIFDVYVQKLNRDEFDIQVAVFVRDRDD
jgi:hypothetical protein